MALADTMAADGNTPFCIGIGSDDATGWPFTDWVEDFMLRLKGPDVYDQWYKHEIPFDDPDVVEVGEAVYDLWSQEGYVYGGVENVAATPFADAGLPAARRQLHDAPPGQLLLGQLPGRHRPTGPTATSTPSTCPASEENPNITLSAATTPPCSSTGPRWSR